MTDQHPEQRARPEAKGTVEHALLEHHTHILHTASVCVTCYVDELQALYGLFYMVAKSAAMLMQALTAMN